MPEKDCVDIRVVLEHINRGQLLDVRRFGDATETHALATESELDEYTYLVAGCVGNFGRSFAFGISRIFRINPPKECETSAASTERDCS